MNDIVIELEKTRVLPHLVRELYPYDGMGYTYAITPPTELRLQRQEYSGVLKKFASAGMIIRIVPETTIGPVGRFKVFVSQPGIQRDEVYWNTVKRYLQISLCDRMAEKPLEFEQIIKELIQ